MLVETASLSFRKARATNSTDGSFPSRVPTITEPTQDGVIKVCTPPEGLIAQNGFLAVFYGTGNNNGTFSSRVIGWRALGEVARQTMLWIPVLLVEVQVTLSNVTGVAGMIVGSSERFADTLSLTVGDAGVSADVVSPANDASIAHIQADLKGFQKLEFIFRIDANVTDMNALWVLL